MTQNQQCTMHIVRKNRCVILGVHKKHVREDEIIRADITTIDKIEKQNGQTNIKTYIQNLPTI